MDRSPADGPTDADLCARVRAGDRDAADLLVRRHTGLVVLMVSARLRPHDQDFDDAVQAGLLGMLRAAQTYDPASGLFHCYARKQALWKIYRILDRMASQTLLVPPRSRSGRRVMVGRRPLPDHLPAPEPPDPEPVTLPDWLVAAIKRLTPAERQAVVRFYGVCGADAIPTAEIAKLVGGTETAVQTHYRKAMHKLRQAAPATTPSSSRPIEFGQ